MPTQTVTWENDQLYIIDQTLLPTEYAIIRLSTLEQVWEAIKKLQVRGAPAIGICAALGVLVHTKQSDPKDIESLQASVTKSADYLATSRPTAVNLFWALDRMRLVATRFSGTTPLQEAIENLHNEAIAILEDDKRICRQMGKHGAELINNGDGILTHCNAGGLATADFGTALAVMYTAHDAGKTFSVFADETRPLLQGARLTAWELDQAGIDVTLICDNMAAQVMREGKIQLILVGSDRIAANGDVANKIGTYAIALLAKAHNIPFYVVSPTSTIDPSISHGDQIPIEIRDPKEIIHAFGIQTAPTNIKVYNPAFDVTPNELITGIITEHGIHRPPYSESLPIQLLSSADKH